jgi:cell division protein FtsB
MIDRLRESRSWQLLLIATLVLLIPLMADISGRMGVLHSMHQERARLTQSLAEAVAEQVTLKAQLEHVSDDQYLEQWARVEGRLARPGETAIIPQFAGQLSNRFTALDDIPSPAGSSSSVSEQWRHFFFDNSSNP